MRVLVAHVVAIAQCQILAHSSRSLLLFGSMRCEFSTLRDPNKLPFHARLSSV